METEEEIDSSIYKRVKVYEMTDTGTWIDKGTGHVECKYVDQIESYAILVRSETDGSGIMNSKVQLSEYVRQQETLILWSDDNLELALSFQEPKGCEDLNQLMEIQKRMAADKHDIDQLPVAKVEEDQVEVEFILPEVELGNLQQIERMFMIGSRHESQRELITKIILETDFIDKLIPLLETCEDLENWVDLYRLANIVRVVFFLNNFRVYSILFEEKHFNYILGMLEYDREYPKQKGNYRQYFNDNVTFKQIIPIINADIITKIHYVYRASYIKDVALARNLEDSTFSALNTMIYNLQADILLHIQEYYLNDVFDLYANESTPIEKKHDIVMFIQDLCTMAKPYQKQAKATLYRNASVAILTNLLENNPAPVRSYCLSQAADEKKMLIAFLIERFVEEEDMGISSQMAENIRILLDTSGIGTNQTLPGVVDADLDKFLDYFYENQCNSLFKPLMDIENATAGTKNDVQSLDLNPKLSSILNTLCEMLSFIITQHAMFSKNYLLHNDILKACGVLLKSKDTFLRLSSLRVFRVCLGTNDEFYRRLLMKQDVFGKIFACILSTEGRNNLLNSACLELFESIRVSEGSKQLITHIATNYKKYFETLSYVGVFKGILLKYEQGLEIPTTSPEKVKPVEKPKDGYDKIDANEEAYFNDGSDEEEPAPIPAKRLPSPPLEFVRGKPLVPYGEEDEEEGIELKKSPVVKRKLVMKLSSDKDNGKRRKQEKRRNRYHQDDPYVAKVDLKERYGELEKRAVKIDELPTETLLLLKRDGKLNDSTVQHLIDIGKLPGPDGKFKKVREKKERTVETAPESTPTTPTPKKRGRPKKKK
ncbi:Platinum sensitivity protein [Terramyces sp. JEL0728]|nr:Platinum sensitivity protein [Terramyces sp. JEL0728]